MNFKHIFFFILISIIFLQCNAPKGQTATLKEKPSDIMPSLNKWKIKLGDGQDIADLMDYEHEDFFYTANDGTEWVVYKTPNSGITSRNSSNTRTELHQIEEWRPQKGGKLNATLKVQKVSTSGDARVAASYSTVVGQIHSSEGHENEPIKIFYKKFPGHEKGSVFWNYEINTEGDNSKRWDYSSAIWGYDMSVVGDTPNTYPEEPRDGIKLGEEFSYEINVYEGVMDLTFKSSGHPTKTFTKSLIASDFIDHSDIPRQTIDMFVPIGRDGTEKPDAYADELQYFKLGAYNQTNGKDPKTNMVWSTGSDVYDGDLEKQYENGSYTEVWFRESRISEGTPPSK